MCALNAQQQKQRQAQKAAQRERKRVDLLQHGNELIFLIPRLSSARLISGNEKGRLLPSALNRSLRLTLTTNNTYRIQPDAGSCGRGRILRASGRDSCRSCRP